jgi:hypothetical protein
MDAKGGKVRRTKKVVAASFSQLLVELPSGDGTHSWPERNEEFCTKAMCVI